MKTMVDKGKSSLNRQIEENLRRAYSQDADAEVPERFTELLKRLREQEQQRDRGGSDDPAEGRKDRGDGHGSKDGS